MAFLFPLARALENSPAAGSLADPALLSSVIDAGGASSSELMGEWLTQYMKTTLIPEDGYVVLAVRRALAPFYDDEYRRSRTVWMEERLEGRDSGIQSLILHLDRRWYETGRQEEAKIRATRIARRYLTVAERLYPNSGISVYEGWIRDRRCRGRVSIAHGWMAAFFRQEERHALSTYVLLHLQSSLRAARSAGVLAEPELRALERELFRSVDELVSDFLDVSGDDWLADPGDFSERRVDIGS